MVSRISRLYGPKFNSDINSGLTNLATAFKPPSMTDVYLAQKMKEAQVAALGRTALQTKLAAGEQPTPADFYGAGISPLDAEKYQLQHESNAAAASGDWNKAGQWGYAANHDYGQTPQGAFTKVVAPGSTIVGPISVAGSLGLSSPVAAGGAGESDSKGDAQPGGAFVYTSPQKESADTLDALKVKYAKEHPEVMPGLLAPNKGVTVNTGAKGLTSTIQDDLSTSFSKAQAAQENVKNLDEERRILEGGKVITGKGAPLITAARGYLSSALGVPDDGVSDTNQFQGLAQRNVGTLARQLAVQGHTTNMDINVGRMMSGTDPEYTQQAMMELNRWNRVLAEDQINRHIDNVNRYKSAVAADDPQSLKAVDYYKIAPVAPYAPATAPPAPVGTVDAPATVKSQSDYDALPAGSHFLGSDGSVMQKPLPQQAPSGASAAAPSAAVVPPPVFATNAIDYLRGLGAGGP